MCCFCHNICVETNQEEVVAVPQPTTRCWLQNSTDLHVKMTNFTFLTEINILTAVLKKKNSWISIVRFSIQNKLKQNNFLVCLPSTY